MKTEHKAERRRLLDEIDRLTAALHRGRSHPDFRYALAPQDAPEVCLLGVFCWERNPEAEAVPGNEWWRRKREGS